MPRTLDDLYTLQNEMVLILERMDRRDRLRTIGGFIRSLLALIPMIIFVVSTWYLYKHGDELMKQLTEEAAKQASKYAESQSASVMEELQKMVPRR